MEVLVRLKSLEGFGLIDGLALHIPEKSTSNQDVGIYSLEIELKDDAILNPLTTVYEVSISLIE